jgi:hypothetical protein
MNNMFVVSATRLPVEDVCGRLGAGRLRCAFHQLQQNLLNALAAHVTRDRVRFSALRLILSISMQM